MKTLTKIIRGVMVYWIIFVAVSWVAFFTTGQIPDTLVQYGLGGGAVELVAGAFIEVGKKLIEKKYKLGGEENDSEDFYGTSDSPVNADELTDAGGQKDA